MVVDSDDEDDSDNDDSIDIKLGEKSRNSFHSMVGLQERWLGLIVVLKNASV